MKFTGRNIFRSLAIIAVAGAASLALGYGVSSMVMGGSAAKPPSIQGTYLKGGKPIADFRLTDDAGRTLNNARLKNQWTFLFFGYTHCPDVCPTTLATLASALDDLRAQRLGKPVRVVFISVDPDRDTPARLGQYVHAFDNDFVGATGSAAEIKHLAGDLGIVYAVHKDQGPNYSVDHSPALLLVNPRGRLQAVLHPPHKPGRIATDFLAVKRAYGH